MLPSRISTPRSSELLESEDIFDSGLNVLFTDDAQNCHGTPGQSVVYSSPRFGEVLLQIPIHPDRDEGRKLFAHYLWNAGIVVAAGIEHASADHEDKSINDGGFPTSGEAIWESKYWDMSNQNVLELGSGTALPSLIAALSNAQSATITDHPDSPAITNDTILKNVRQNLFRRSKDEDSFQQPTPRSSTNVSIHGYVWGETIFTSASQYGKASSPQSELNSFNKIIIADCLWIPSQHVNLVKTILLYLASDSNENEPRQESTDSTSLTHSRKETRVNCALVVAGFHTGRATVAEFFRVATGSTTGDDETTPKEKGRENEDDDIEEVEAVKGSLRAATIYEIDVNANVRSWLPVRSDETREEAKRWCVVAALIKR